MTNRSGEPLASEAANLLATEWAVKDRYIGSLLGLDEAGVAELRAGREPSGLDAAGALRLGTLIGALPHIAERHGRDRVRETLAGSGRAGHMCIALYTAEDVGQVIDVLDMIETLLEYEAIGGGPLESPLVPGNNYGRKRR